MAYLIVASGGSNQSAYTNTKYPIALYAQVTEFGVPVVGVSVTFRMPPLSGPTGIFDGGGPAAAGITNASGIAQSPDFSANGIAGGQWSPTCELTSDPSFFNTYFETNLARVASVPATITAVQGFNQSAAFGAVYSTALRAEVRDQYGDLLAGAPVTFTIPAGMGSFPGPSQTAVVNTNISGLSTAPALTAGSTAGSFSVTAQTSVSAVNVSFTNLFNVNPAVAVRLQIISGNNQKAAAAFALPLKVQVMNGVNGGVAGVSVTFTGPGSGASCTFPGGGTAVTVASDASGYASSGTVTSNDTLGSYTVTASSSGLGSVLFSLTNGLNYKPEVCTPQESIDCFNTNAGGSGPATNWTNPTSASSAGGGGSFANVTVTTPNSNRSNIMRSNQPASWAAIPDDARINKIIFQYWVRGSLTISVLEVTPAVSGAANPSPSSANVTPTASFAQRPLVTFTLTGTDQNRTGALLKAGWGVNFRQTVTSLGNAKVDINGLTISVCYQEVDPPLVISDIPLMFCEA